MFQINKVISLLTHWSAHSGGTYVLCNVVVLLQTISFRPDAYWLQPNLFFFFPVPYET